MEARPHIPLFEATPVNPGNWHHSCERSSQDQRALLVAEHLASHSISRLLEPEAKESAVLTSVCQDWIDSVIITIEPYALSSREAV